MSSIDDPMMFEEPEWLEWGEKKWLEANPWCKRYHNIVRSLNDEALTAITAIFNYSQWPEVIFGPPPPECQDLENLDNHIGAKNMNALWMMGESRCSERNLEYLDDPNNDPVSNQDLIDILSKYGTPKLVIGRNMRVYPSG